MYFVMSFVMSCVMLPNTRSINPSIGSQAWLKPRQSGARCGRVERITPHYLALPPLPPEYLIIRAICRVREP